MPDARFETPWLRLRPLYDGGDFCWGYDRRFYCCQDEMPFDVGHGDTIKLVFSTTPMRGAKVSRFNVDMDTRMVSGALRELGSRHGVATGQKVWWWVEVRTDA